MPTKRTSNAKKRDPKEERRALKAEFDAAHADGMRALKKRDLEGLERAIARERDIIKRQAALSKKAD